ncbi:helix-turn-helix domain-containing protein, partial [Elusimicrobiota bacterium]
MSKDIYKLVGIAVRDERKKAGLTIEKLAEIAGISPSFLCYVETAGKKASLRTVQKLAGALGVPV